MGGDDVIRQVLGMRRWAVVGCTPDTYKPSGFVPEFLLDRGYEVVPVNPMYAGQQVLGAHCYETLADVPGPIDVVDMFRRSSMVGVHVDEAIAIGARGVWMQLGVIDEAAAARARDAGLEVVMDRCPAIELPKLGIAGYSAPGPG